MAGGDPPKEELIRFRNTYAAFGGDFKVLDSGDKEIRLAREKGASQCTLHVHLDSRQAVIEYRDESGKISGLEM